MRFLRDALAALERDPGGPALTLAGGEGRTISREDLLRRVGSVAAQVRACTNPGDRVLVALPWGESLVLALLGVLFAGRTVVPAPGDAGPRTRQRLRAIVADAGCALAFAAEAVGGVPTSLPRIDLAPVLDPPQDGLALLQYTSGSTAEPKGVRVSGANLDANLALIAKAFDQGPDDVVVSWLPMHHDMGLIGTLLHPLRSGQHAVLISPASFLVRPALWLHTISAHRASSSGGPDFGYAMVADRVDPAELPDVDLSCWRVAFTGSEPVSPQTLRRFAGRFGTLGFRENAFTPCYGMAETTLLVAAAPVGRPVRIVDGRVGCGVPFEEVVITDADGQVLRDGVGEIRVRGASVANGYHGRADADEFGTRTVEGRGGWLRTGDLGMLNKGELFVTGRLKDLLILHGANHHPQDIEALVAEAVPGAITCAFPLPGPRGEGIGLAIEAAGDATQAALAARRSLREALGIDAAAVGIVRGRALPRTTSGKLQRAACRQAWLDGRLPLRHVWTAAAAGAPLEGVTETKLAALWTELLGTEVVSAEASFFALGGASLLALEFSARIATRFGVTVPAHALLAAGHLRAQAQLIDAAPPAETAPREPDSAPVTLQQEGLLVLSKLAGSTPAPVTVTVEIDGGGALDRALAELVARHPILSAQGPDAADEVRRVPWVPKDRPPSLAEGSPFTARRDSRTIELRWDHLVIDGWSVAILLNELASLLDGQRLGAPAPSAFAWARAQREGLAAGSAAPSLDFYRTHWGDTRIGLPWPRTRDATAGLHRQELGDRAGLAASAMTLDTTVAQLGLAAIAVVLARLSSQEVVRIGIPIAGRDAGWERTVGCLVSLQLACIAVGDSLTGRQLLSRLKGELDALRQHASVPLEAVPPRLGLARHPDLVDVVFDHLALPETVGRLRIIDGSPFQRPAAAKAPLTVTLLERDAVELSLLYQCGYLTGEHAAELADQMALALQHLVANPDAPCRAWPLRTQRADERFPLDRGPLPATDLPLVAELVFANDPNAAALHRGGEVWRYGDLFAQALRVCGSLQRSGMRPGEVIGVLGYASFETVAAMLGVLAAGGVVLSLDRRLPAGRMAMMVQQAGARIIVRCGSAEPADAELGAPILEPDGAPGQRVPVLGSGPAYVVFTTGSTRTPKAILGTHRGLAHFLGWQARTFGIDASDRFVCLTNLAFDMALRDVWLPLTTGAQLHLLDDPRQIDGAHIVPLLARWGVTRLHLVPTLGRLWLQSAPVRPLPALRSVFFAGEPLTEALASRFQAQFPGRYEILNFYGPSETTQTKVFHRVPAIPDPGVQPIGRPLPQTSVALINRAGAACGLLEAGEIVIRTPFATRGYMNAPADQAARFALDPLGSGETVYRSGDLGRARLDGAIEIVGRGDTQVKVRGVAVDPSEIADLLAGLGGVRQAAVVAERQEDGDHKLLAWFAGERAASALRSELAGQLPAALVPERIMRLDALPTHPNGKVDTRSLPRDLSAAEATPEMPPDALEAAVLELLRKTLGLPELDLGAGFLDCGGHSIKAIECVAAIRRTLGRDLSPLVLLQNATPRSAARALASAPPAPPTLVTLTPDPANALAAFPMTRVQEAYWVGRREFLALGNAAAQTYRELRCPPDFDLGRFAQALDALVRRHPMLRTVATPDGLQRVLADLPAFRIETQDLRGEDAPMALIEAWRREMGHRVRPLESWPLIEVRASLLRDEVRLHFGIDAFICDAWSRVVLLEELRALMQHPETELPPIDVTFRDYVLAAAQRPREAAWAWWQGRLADLPPPPRLPLRRREATGFTRRQGQLDKAEWARLQQHAAKAGVTASAALLAAFGWVLARWCGHERFTINLTVFQRLPIHPDINRVIGDFTTVLPHAVEADASDFQRHARAEQARLWQELAHAEVSGIDLAREIARQSGAIEATGFPVVFTSALTTPDMAREFDWSWLGELVHGISQTPQVWLDLQVYEHRGELHANWDCVEALFQPGVCDAMFAAWHRLLGWMADGPWDRAPIDLLPEEDRALVARANPAPLPLPEETLVDGVLASAARDPNAVAVIDPDRSLSFAALVNAAERVAAAILAAGVEPGAVVAVLAPHGSWQAVAALGALMAGTAYLPIALDQPRSRIERVLAEAGPALVLHTASAWQGGIVLESLPDASARRLPRPADLAYVIYTSGSTGAPKGVMVRHRGAVNTLQDIARRLALTGSHRSLALSDFAFDLSVWDLFGSWRIGSAIVYPGDRLSPRSWLEAIDRHGARLWNSVPMMAQMLLDEVASDPALKLPGTIDRIMLSGDWIPPPLAERIRAAWPGARLWSLGGATEGSIWSVAYEIEGPPSGEAIPYGRAMTNQTATVLDPSLRPCPVWVTGRIFIGGAGVADGYWRRPELTSERFLSAGQERLYDTGDLGRWRPDGNLEILGRADTQVKLRGHRVELSEIEHALEALPDVERACVLTVGTAQLRLAAFVVPRASQGLEAIQAELARRLPDYMVPSAWTRLDALPLTANGKVDRAALRRRAAEPGPAPQPAGISEILLAAWEKTLGARPSGPSANFFSSGGDSVTWLRLCAEVSRAGWRLPTAAVTLDPTLAGLSQRVVPAAPVEPVSRSAPLAPMQAWLTQRPELQHFNQAILLALAEPIPAARLRRAVLAVAVAHPAFGISIEAAEQVFRDVVPDWEHAEALTSAAIAQACRRIDPAGPLLRATAFDDGHLLLCAHHIACDAHSWSVFVADLEAALDAWERDLPPQIAPEPLSFGSWSRAVAQLPRPAALRRSAVRAGVGGVRGRWPTLLSPASLPEILDRQRCSQEEFFAAAALCARGRAEQRWEIDLERNGRALEGVDCSRTIGWLTALVPLAVEPGAPSAVLRQVKETLRRMPAGGLALAAAQVAGGSDSGMAVNPLGTLTQAQSRRFRLRRDLPLPVSDDDCAARHGTRLTFAQQDGALVADIAHAEHADGLFMALDTALIELERLPPNAATTADDFPGSGLDSDELDELIAMIGAE